MAPALSAPTMATTERRRDLRASVRDGIAFSLMVGAGEAYVPAFAHAAGFGPITVSLVATLPMLAGGILQLVSPAAVRRLGSYRRWIVLCARLQAACFIPLLAGALTGRITVTWLFASVACYWAFGMATGPAWNAWVETLVPRPLRTRFFASRARYAQAALLVSVVAAGLVIEAGRGRTDHLLYFAAIFTFAIGARLVSARALARQSDPPGLASHLRMIPARDVASHLRGTSAARLLAYLLALQVAVQICGPFFTPFMLGPLGLSYVEMMALTSVAFLARIGAMPVLGRAVGRLGAGRVLHIGAAAVIPLPVLWLVSDAFSWLIAVQIAAGFGWAAVEYSTQLAIFENIPRDDRASVLTAFNLAHTLAMAVGSILGAGLFAWAGDLRSTYALLFIVSLAARLLALGLLRGVPVRVPVLRVVLRTDALRPSWGAVQRPILTTLETESPTTEERSTS
jgi:MFS family permease